MFPIYRTVGYYTILMLVKSMQQKQKVVQTKHLQLLLILVILEQRMVNKMLLDILIGMY